jgi:predicted MFS family arabinose efflux permease
MTSLQKARFAVFAYFTIAGAAMTFWAVHIPYVENKLEISHSTIGGLLLVLGAGALTASLVIGQFIDRVGSRTATFTAAVFMGLMLFLPGFAAEEIVLGLSLFGLGFGIGATDISMNAHAVEVEKEYGRPIFSAFHAMWSFGGLLGATLGGLALANNLEMQVTLAIAGIFTLIVAICMRGWLLPDQPNQQRANEVNREDKQLENQKLKVANTKNRKVIGYVLFLGAMAGAAAIAEGTGVDWSALHHARILGTTDAYASIALAVFAGAMGITRLVIDKVVAIRGRIFVIRYGSLVSAVGTSLVVVSTTSPVALIGWLIAGIGIAGVVPQLFAYSAEVGEKSHTGRNMGKVVGITYAGVLAGPAIIGFLTIIVPLNIALGLGVALGLFTALGTLLIERRNLNAKAI